MKKLIIFLLLCSFVIPVCTVTHGLDSDNKVYSITFVNETVDDLKLVYESVNEISFDVPVEYTLASNTPISTNYNWVCWHNEETNQDFYPGDKIKIYNNLLLRAEWKKKSESSSDFLNEVVARIGAFVKKIFEFLGYYNVEKYSVPLENKYNNNCRLIVNGNDISDEVYVNADTETGVYEVPFLAIVKELGADVIWKNDNIVCITYNDLSIEYDISQKDFGLLCPPGATKSRKIVDGDLIVDYPSIRMLLKNMFNAYITVDKDEQIVYVTSQG